MIALPDPADTAIRAAAFAHVKRLQTLHDALTSDHLKAGFIYEGQRVPLVNPQRGIFKPQRMKFLLSIRTVFPRPGGQFWYDDQRQVHQQIYAGEESVHYAFMGDDPDAADNRWLREAFETQTPIIYFLGTSPGRYQAIVPTFVTDWDRYNKRASISFAEVKAPHVSSIGPERRYALRAVKQRLHQATFRDAVITAYKGRCALSGLPEPMLLDAAHIISDADEPNGQPVVPNGIPLSKIHHAAFDAHLIGIDPDFRIHVGGRLLEQRDGPMLEALKSLHLSKLLLPERRQDWPDRDRLEIRYRQFVQT